MKEISQEGWVRYFVEDVAEPFGFDPKKARILAEQIYEEVREMYSARYSVDICPPWNRTNREDLLERTMEHLLGILISHKIL